MPAIVCAPSKRTTPSTEAGMHDSTSDQHNAPQAKGLLRPGRFLWARALPWGVVLVHVAVSAAVWAFVVALATLFLRPLAPLAPHRIP